MIALLSSYWKPLALCALAAAIYLYGHHVGEMAVKTEWEKQTLAAQKSVIIKERRASNINNEVSNAIQNRFDSIRQQYADDRVRFAASGSMSAPAGSSGAGHAAACHNGLSQSERRILAGVAETYRQLMEEADYQSADLQGGQKWVRDQETIFNK